MSKLRIVGQTVDLLNEFVESMVIEPIFLPNPRKSSDEWKRDTSWKRGRREQYTR
jgi:hypothetical protein